MCDTTIGICLIVSKYDFEMLNILLENINNMFFPQYNKTYFIFSNEKYISQKNIVNIYVPDGGYVMNNLLKFKYFFDNKSTLVCDLLFFFNIHTKITNNVHINFENNTLITSNNNGNFFGGHRLLFFDIISTICNKIIDNLSYDIFVNKWNYQINKYIESYSNTVNITLSSNCMEIFQYSANEYFENIISIDLIGGLGNLLFQIAAALNYSKILNKKIIFSIFKINNPRKSICSYRMFDKLYKTNSKIIFNTLATENSSITNFEGNVKLKGYYQLIKYINDIHHLINYLCFDYFTNVDHFFNNITKINNQIISVHIRRTDYLRAKKYHNLSLNYYMCAISHFDPLDTYLIFSDDIKWCKQQFFSNLNNVIFIETFNDEESLYLMSKCNHNIIANSTFSLWGYYLNININKKLIISNKWYTDEIFNISSIISKMDNVVIVED